MKILLGPILHFRGQQGNEWCTSALIVTKGGLNPPRFTVQVSNKVSCHLLKKIHSRYAGNNDGAVQPLLNEQVYYAWRFDWSVMQTGKEQRVIYTVENKAYQYVVPGKEGEMRIAYGSCFGFASADDAKKIKDRNAMWRKLLSQHQQPENAYHLLFMGGDQVYADRVRDVVPSFNRMFKRSALGSGPVPSAVTEKIEAFYLQLYLENFSEKEASEAMQQIPTLMMWDDHDIFDGWGSRPDEQQNSPLLVEVFRIAREYFCLFQLQSVSGNEMPGLLLKQQYPHLIDKPRGNLTYAYRINDVALIGLDLRTERTRELVMGKESWVAVENWMEQNACGCSHLFIVSSIPVIYVDTSLLETFFDWLPGDQEFENSIIDRWGSRKHQQEQLWLIRRLFRFSEENRCRITLISGDVHSAAVGHIKSDWQQGSQKRSNIMHQLVSSAMVNVPVSSLKLSVMDCLFGSKKMKIDANSTARMEKFDKSQKRLLGVRNFLSIKILKEKTLRVDWFTEDERGLYSKEVQPFGR